MESSRSLSLHLFMFFLAVSSCISDKVLALHGSIGRSLLQQKTNCSVDLEHMNYTVITSQCIEPTYASEMCCPPLKELVCPMKDEFNNLSTNCANSFFIHLNRYGKYPPGLFAELCKENGNGLDCESAPQPSASEDVSQPSAQKNRAPSSHNSKLFVILVGLLTPYFFKAFPLQ